MLTELGRLSALEGANARGTAIAAGSRWIWAMALDEMEFRFTKLKALRLQKSVAQLRNSRVDPPGNGGVHNDTGKWRLYEDIAVRVETALCSFTDTARQV